MNIEWHIESNVPVDPVQVNDCRHVKRNRDTGESYVARALVVTVGEDKLQYPLCMSCVQRDNLHLARSLASL